LGFALSTTQVASGSVIGSGLGRRGSTVRWRTAGRIGLGWLMTLPASAAIGAIAALIAHLGTVGLIIDAVIGLGVILFIFWRSSRNKVHAGNAVPVPDVAESGHAIRIKQAKVRRVKTETGTLPPLTNIAMSAATEDKERKRALKAAQKAAKEAAKREKKERKQNGTNK
ncbi:MAG: inorganic phosphate transporter, partial [Microbacteriaceae bacterium]